MIVWIRLSRSDRFLGQDSYSLSSDCNNLTVNSTTHFSAAIRYKKDLKVKISTNSSTHWRSAIKLCTVKTQACQKLKMENLIWKCHQDTSLHGINATAKILQVTIYVWVYEDDARDRCYDDDDDTVCCGDVTALWSRPSSWPYCWLRCWPCLCPRDLQRTCRPSDGERSWKSWQRLTLWAQVARQS